MLTSTIQSLWVVVALTLPAHHADSFTFDSLEPSVSVNRINNLELTMTITPVTGNRANAELAYEMDYRNVSQDLLVNLAILNPIPVHTQYRVGSATKGKPPEAITEVLPLFSNDGGLTWNYTPVSGGGGAPGPYDANVTHIRFMLNGVLTPGTASTAGVGFTVRVHTD